MRRGGAADRRRRLVRAPMATSHGQRRSFDRRYDAGPLPSPCPARCHVGGDDLRERAGVQRPAPSAATTARVSPRPATRSEPASTHRPSGSCSVQRLGVPRVDAVPHMRQVVAGRRSSVKAASATSADGATTPPTAPGQTWRAPDRARPGHPVGDQAEPHRHRHTAAVGRLDRARRGMSSAVRPSPGMATHPSIVTASAPRTARP